MARERDTGTNAETTVDASADVVPADDKRLYLNDSAGTHPREHQPAVPSEAESANEEAANRVAPNADVQATVPSGITAPKVIEKSAGEVNEEVSKVNAEGK